MSAFTDLHALLIAEQEHRAERGGLAWIVAEREAMHRRVNELRVQAGKLPVPEGEIRRAEDSACGHFDYTKKFALYCAGLVAID